jgi:hypothetical protein
MNMESWSGPNNFTDAGAAQTKVKNLPTIDPQIVATLTGGVILTATTACPANQTSVYGTAKWHNPTYPSMDPDPSLTNPITITFSKNVTNLYLNLYNGMLVPIPYRVSDNLGNSSTINVVSNYSSGVSLIGPFVTAGNIITIEALDTGPYDDGFGTSVYWDFLIDNIVFELAALSDYWPMLGPLIGAFTRDRRSQ